MGRINDWDISTHVTCSMRAMSLLDDEYLSILDIYTWWAIMQLAWVEQLEVEQNMSNQCDGAVETYLQVGSATNWWSVSSEIIKSKINQTSQVRWTNRTWWSWEAIHLPSCRNGVHCMWRLYIWACSFQARDRWLRRNISTKNVACVPRTVKACNDVWRSVHKVDSIQGCEPCNREWVYKLSN